MDTRQTFAYRLRHDGVAILRQVAPYLAVAWLHIRAAQLVGTTLQGRLTLLGLALHLSHCAQNVVSELYLPPGAARTRAQWQNRVCLHALGPGLFLSAILAVVCERLGIGTQLLCALVLAVPAGSIAYQGGHLLMRAHAYALRSRTLWPQVLLISLMALVATAKTADTLLPLSFLLAPILTAAVTLQCCRKVVYSTQEGNRERSAQIIALALEQTQLFLPPLIYGLWHAHTECHGTARIAPFGIALGMAVAARAVDVHVQRAFFEPHVSARHERRAKSPREVLGHLGSAGLTQTIVLIAMGLLVPWISHALGRGYHEIGTFLLLLSPGTLAATLAQPLREDLLARKLLAAEQRSALVALMTTAAAAIMFCPLRSEQGLAVSLGMGQIAGLAARLVWWVSLRRIKAGATTRSSAGSKNP